MAGFNLITEGAELGNMPDYLVLFGRLCSKAWFVMVAATSNNTLGFVVWTVLLGGKPVDMIPIGVGIAAAADDGQ
jgi:hypothetical protein